MSPEEFVALLCLEADEVEDVAMEMEDALEAWRDLLDDRQVVKLDEHPNIWTKLAKKLGTTHSSETCERTAKELADNEGNVTQSAFIDWYVRYVFKSDDDEEYVEEEVQVISTEKATTSDSKPSGWGNISWSVAPNSEVKEGETWKCKNCFIVNKWEQAQCIGCDVDAPHADTLPKPEKPVAAATHGFTFGAPAATTTAPASGFTFGAPSTSDSSSTSNTTVFTFGSASVASTAPSGGFVFGSTPVDK